MDSKLTDDRLDPRVNWATDTVPLEIPGYRTFPIPVSVWLTHTDFVEPLIAALRPKITAEVGVYTGASLLVMRALLEYHQVRCQMFGVDSWAGANSGTSGWEWDGEACYKLLRYRISSYNNITLLRMDSLVGSYCFPDSSIDLLHIDADHREEGVRRDLAAWLPKVAPRGIVLMHDVGMVTEDCQVWRVWREIQEKYPTYADTRACGLGCFAPKGVPEGLERLLRRAIVV